MSAGTHRSYIWCVCVGAALVVAGPAAAFADHVVLRNGDSLTGKVVSQSPSAVVFDCELAGRVTLKRDAITELKSDSTTPAAAGAAWTGTLNAGFDLSRGNSETATVTTNGTMTRSTDRDRFGMFGTYLFSAVGSGADAVTTARAARGGLRYDHDLVGPIFGFGFGDAETDVLQLLDLRTVVGGGAGAHVVKTDMTQLNFFGGVSYASDSYAAAITTTTTTSTPSPSSGSTVTPPGQGARPRGRAGRRPG